ncbi:MAG TPA: LuxR C-terminal-related transcriptional regulator, partial [Actinotalea sp.]|nr:LuxR C-terminal-related transcriptional regulator [Actinotalea sp.]
EPLVGRLRELMAPPLFADPIALVDSLHEVLYDVAMPLTVVLDDAHHIAPSARASQMLDHFLTWAPSTTRAVLIGRSMPPLRLQRLRLEDRLELIGHGDLVFTRQETAAAVLAAGLELDAVSAASLHDVAQGWPAGVRMAVLAMQSGSRRELAFELPRDDALADYLATEVLASLDDELSRFVLEATVDDLVCPALVDAARGTHDAAVLLERCVSLGLFLTREDGATEGVWYRWHALFAAHMRARRWTVGQARVDELELGASAWWNGVDPMREVSHALTAGDREAAGRVVASSWLELVLAGRVDTVRSLVASIPAGTEAGAELHLALALLAAQSGDPQTGRAELVSARAAADLLGAAGRARFEIRATVIELFVVNDRAGLVEAVATGRRLLREPIDTPWAPDRATQAFVQLWVGMGEARLQEDLAGALQLLGSAAATARSAGYVALELSALAETCIPLIAQGELTATRDLATSVLATAQAKGWGEFPSLAPAHAYLGWLALWQGDPRRARDVLDRALGQLLSTDWTMRGLATVAHFQACVDVGDLPAAEADVRRTQAMARSGQMPPYWPSLLAALEAALLVAQGEIDRALELVRAPAPGPEYHLAACYRADVLLRAGLPQDCLEVLGSVPPARMFPHVEVWTCALRAPALVAVGRTGEAHTALERALGRAAPEGIVEPFLLVGPVLEPLLREHLRRGTAHPDLVVQVSNRLAAAGTTTVNQWGETLTAREHKILRYLATNLSNGEIAEAEFISLNTTKTHVAHIYRKLGVSNRRAAVRRAAELGFL